MHNIQVAILLLSFVPCLASSEECFEDLAAEAWYSQILKTAGVRQVLHPRKKASEGRTTLIGFFNFRPGERLAPQLGDGRTVTVRNAVLVMGRRWFNGNGRVGCVLFGSTMITMIKKRFQGIKHKLLAFNGLSWPRPGHLTGLGVLDPLVQREYG